MIDEREIREIVREVIGALDQGQGASGAKSSGAGSGHGGRDAVAASAGGASGGGTSAGGAAAEGTAGVFLTMDQALSAAKTAFERLKETPLETRRSMIETMRRRLLENLDVLSEVAASETGMGRADDKRMKNRLVIEKTPGVEDIEPFSYTDDDGLTLVERAPYGVIGTITPSTNPTETVICNSIGMIAGGNTVVFNPHPGAKRCSSLAVSIINNAIREAGGPENVVVTVTEPTIESATYMMGHGLTAMLVVTGGPGVVRAAMKTQKKVIAAGPGNPPVVVDETGDIPKAARDIVAGASLDNNIICTDEKEVLVVSSVADQLKSEMKKQPVVELTREQTEALTSTVIAEPGSEGVEGMANKQFVGQNASVLARAIGLSVSDEVRLLICEVHENHPLVWTEQLMPILPIVRMPNVDSAIDLAVRCEHGFRHTASMHSKNIDKLSKMARVMDCTLFVKNGSNFNGLGKGGAGPTSFTLASPTGEGFTRPRTFTRERRCALIGSFRIV
jgi:acyl-CoA reductase-like NAD-dependent aldehyde dehydrogenase